MFQVEEYPELWADACLRDSEGRFLFLSLYGRDGALMQFMSALYLGSKAAQGCTRFHLVEHGPVEPGTDSYGGYIRKRRHLVEVGGADRLEKHSGRLPKGNIFGPVSQMWLFDKALQKPDRENRIGWALQRQDDGDDDAPSKMQERVWTLIKTLSPVALLEHWRKPVITWFLDKGAVQVMDSTMYPALGPITGARVSVTDHFVQFISDSVRQGTLRLN